MRNTRIIYSVTLLTVVGLYVYSQVISYKNFQNEVENQVEYYNTLYAKTVHSTFHEIEFILDGLGKELLKDKKFLDVKSSERIMQDMLDRVDYLAGFGLTDPEGNYIAFSAGIDKSKVVGLQKNPDTADSFLRTLQSDVMTIGKVYLFKELNQWVIPLRKTLRNESGQIVGVMTTGILVESAAKFFENVLISPEQISLLVNDTDLRRVFISPLKTDLYREFYSQPIAREHYAKVINKIAKSADMSETAIKDAGLNVNFEGTSDILQKKSVNSARFDKRYGIWALTMVPYETARTLFLKDRFFLKLIIFFGAIITSFYLFVVTDRKEAAIKKELTYRALHDPLTHLYNRQALSKIAERWIQPKASSFVLFYIDLDNFKNLNDSFGHSYGDQILFDVAERIKEQVPKQSEIFRIGGDEFAVFIKEKEESIGSVAETLISRLSEPYYIAEFTLHLGASIGISRFPDDAISLEKLLIMADLAMYDAKKRKNSYALYNTELQEKMKRKTSIENQLRQALARDELFMMYQPQISKNGKIHGAEALIRWKSPQLGFVPPDQFIGIAEETGLMPQLGAFIIERTCKEIRDIIDQCNEHIPDLSISINISVKQILEKNFKKDFLNVLGKYEIDPGKITIEITESLFIDELDYILPLLNEIQATGISISLDDFGTGYSSLSMLRTLPIDELKIDRSFINGILESEQDSQMAQSIISMGHTMNIKVLSEGVEEKDQFDLLNSYGCDLYQGYYFSRPLMPSDLISFIKNSRPS